LFRVKHSYSKTYATFLSKKGDGGLSDEPPLQRLPLQGKTLVICPVKLIPDKDTIRATNVYEKFQ
jgi:hypothetical protein